MRANQSATQNLNVTPHLVSLFTFRAFITPCRQVKGERCEGRGQREQTDHGTRLGDVHPPAGLEAVVGHHVGLLGQQRPELIVLGCRGGSGVSRQARWLAS